VRVFDPLAFEAVSVIVYVPGVKYVAVGFCKTEVLPFPKFQFHPVGLPVDKSWKCTISGEHPERGDPEKLAVGTCACKLVTEKKTVITAISLERIWFIKGFKRWQFWFSTTKVIRVQKLFLINTGSQNKFLVEESALL